MLGIRTRDRGVGRSVTLAQLKQALALVSFLAESLVREHSMWAEISLYRWSPVKLDWIRPNKKKCCNLYLVNPNLSSRRPALQ